MKKIIITVLLVLASLPAFSKDNSASAWEYRRQNCTYVAQVAAAGRNTAMQGKPEPFIPVEHAKDDPFYTIAAFSLAEGYRSPLDPEAVGRMAYAKCLDNVDRISYEWQKGIKTDPKNFQ